MRAVITVNITPTGTMMPTVDALSAGTKMKSASISIMGAIESFIFLEMNTTARRFLHLVQRVGCIVTSIIGHLGPVNAKSFFLYHRIAEQSKIDMNKLKIIVPAEPENQGKKTSSPPV